MLPHHDTSSSASLGDPASCGVLYVATGEKYTHYAVQSAESVKKHCANLQVHLCSDLKDFQHDSIDSISLIENSHRRSKVDYLFRTPFQRTLYLDTDTRVVDDIREMFSLLDRFDIALAQAHARNRTATLETWRVAIPYAFPQLNAGVILFSKSAQVVELLKQWQEAYHSAGFAKDQTTLRELLWNSNLRLAILPPEYNIRYKKYLLLWRKREAAAKILHFKKFHAVSRMEKVEKSLMKLLRRA